VKPQSNTALRGDGQRRSPSPLHPPANQIRNMTIKPYDGDFDALTGAIFASWFSLGPKGPAAYAVGFAETTHRPWSLFYRGMRPTGATTYLGAAVDQEIAAAEDFLDMFFNLLLGLNNYFVVYGGEEPLFPEIPAIVRTIARPLRRSRSGVGFNVPFSNRSHRYMN